MSKVNCPVMTQDTLELTEKQQEILLRGLRFVRSAVAMEAREPSDDVVADRQQNYEEIERLESLINRRTLPQKG